MAQAGAPRVPQRPARRSPRLAGGLLLALIATVLLHLGLAVPLDRALRAAGEAAVAEAASARETATVEPSAPADAAASAPGLAAAGTAPVPPGSPAAAPSAAPLAAPPEPRGASAPAPGAVPFEQPIGGLVWPRSTRLSYRVDGWFRGEVSGSAQVEWLRSGADGYQVHLEVWIGARAAPLMRRRMSSEGRIGETGLHPQRYEQETRVLIGRDRRLALSFGAEGIVLADGRRVEPQAGLQDSASQFIQLIYLLRTRPELARPGQAMEFPLALPNRVDRWTYELAEAVVLDTPLGRLETLHVLPRRRAPGGHLTAQMWYAPALQMLPVRIRIEQDEQTWIDLKLERAPEQSGS